MLNVKVSCPLFTSCDFNHHPLHAIDYQTYRGEPTYFLEPSTRSKASIIMSRMQMGSISRSYVAFTLFRNRMKAFDKKWKNVSWVLPWKCAWKYRREAMRCHNTNIQSEIMHEMMSHNSLGLIVPPVVAIEYFHVWYSVKTVSKD